MKRVKDLPIGSKIKDVNTKYLLEGIFWGAAMAVHDQESGGGTRAVRS